MVAVVQGETVQEMLERVKLTGTEEKLLRAMVFRGQMPLRAPDELIRETWGDDYLIDADMRASSTHMLRVVISRLRSKLRGSGWKITTRPGFGYGLEREATPQQQKGVA